MTTEPNPPRRGQVMTGDLPGDFLTINNTENLTVEQQIARDAHVAQSLQAQESMGVQFAASVVGRLSITLAQAKLAKNYGLTKMDPYCRIRVGHSIYETPSSYNGAKNPRWNNTINASLPNGVDSIYIEIFDERSLTTDEKIAWAHITIPTKVMEGQVVDDWYALSWKEGSEKEGMINIIFSYKVGPPQVPQMMTYGNPYQPQMVYLNSGGAPAMPGYYPAAAAVPGVTVANYPPPPVAVGSQYPLQQPPPSAATQMSQPQPNSQGGGGTQPPPQQQQQPPAPPVNQGPLYTEQDFLQVKEMFPQIEDQVIKSVMEANRGNKDRSINSLLSINSD